MSQRADVFAQGHKGDLLQMTVMLLWRNCNCHDITANYKVRMWEMNEGFTALAGFSFFFFILKRDVITIKHYIYTMILS